MADFLRKRDLTDSYVRVDAPDCVGIVQESWGYPRKLIYRDNNFRLKGRGRKFPIPKWVREGVTDKTYLRLDRIDVAPDGHPIFRGKISSYIVEEKEEKKAFYSEHYKFGEWHDDNGYIHHNIGIIVETSHTIHYRTSEEDGINWLFYTGPEVTREYVTLPEGFHGKSVEKTRERKKTKLETFFRGPLYDEPDYFLKETRQHYGIFVTQDSYHVTIEDGKIVEVYDGEETVQLFIDDMETTTDKLKIVSKEIVKEWSDEDSGYEHDEDGKTYYRIKRHCKMITYHFEDGSSYTQTEYEPIH